MTPPSVDESLTFFYYKDIAKAGEFYEKIMGSSWYRTRNGPRYSK